MLQNVERDTTTTTITSNQTKRKKIKTTLLNSDFETMTERTKNAFAEDP